MTEEPTEVTKAMTARAESWCQEHGVDLTKAPDLAHVFLEFYRHSEYSSKTCNKNYKNALEDALTRKIEQPDPHVQPVVISEAQDNGSITKLSVIWDTWEDLSQQERSEVIMSSWTVAKGLQEAAKISVALGLTSAEAERIFEADLLLKGLIAYR